MTSADQDKVQALMESIQEIGLKEPVSLPIRQQLLSVPLSSLPISVLCLQIDILEVDGKFYGFSGCHRFEVSNFHAVRAVILYTLLSSFFGSLQAPLVGVADWHLLQAFQKLGIENIPCKVRKANQNTLKMHLM